MQELRQTVLYRRHKELGAKMVPFAGYEMPVSYAGIQTEHFAVRRAAGIFDASHMGVIAVSGSDALTLVQKVSVNDASRLEVGDCQYSAMCYENGTCVDDIYVLRVDRQVYHLVVNASNKIKDLEWIQDHALGFRVNLAMLDVGILALQGPKAPELAERLLGQSVALLRRNQCTGVSWEGVSFQISRTGYTGEDGFELFPPPHIAEALWNQLLLLGAQPCGLGCRDTLRLESGFSLYGHEISEQIHLLEAGLSWIVGWQKADFIGKTALEKYRAQGFLRKLVGLEAVGKVIPRDGQTVVDRSGVEIGVVTSGGMSPVLNRGIALALVALSSAEIGAEVHVRVREQLQPFRIVKRRFVP